MTAKPRPTIAEAIARHAAAQAAFNARISNSDEISIPLCDAVNGALDKLAGTPCGSDAEFLEKLKYLLVEETRLNGALNFSYEIEFGSVVFAAALHFGVSHETEDEGPSLADFIGSENWGNA
jgi:hypothetical protein